MVFTSLSYLLFLPFIVLAYYIFPSRFRWLLLVMASVAYYLSFIPIFFALIVVMVIGNYFGGRWLFKANERGNGKQALTILVILNIVVLAFFKYFNFFFPDFKVSVRNEIMYTFVEIQNVCKQTILINRSIKKYFLI